MLYAAKADTYAALGVEELWLVDLERRSIEQRALAGGVWKVVGTSSGADVLESVRFPGLRVVPGEVLTADVA